METSQTPVQVVSLYHQKDKTFCHDLMTHLLSAKGQRPLVFWDESQIRPGEQTEVVLQKKLAMADIIVPLLSADFLFSCAPQINLALERASQGALLMPVVMRLVDLTGTIWDKIPTLPTRGRAVDLWSNRDEILTEVSQKIHEVADTISQAPLIPEPQKILPASHTMATVLPASRATATVLPTSHTTAPVLPASVSKGKKKRFPVVISVLLLFALIAFMLSGAWILKTTLFAGSATGSDDASSLIPVGQSPLFSDPLTSDNRTSQWNTSASSTGTCAFMQGQLRLLAPAGSGEVDCHPAGFVVSNFVYQIKMTILSGLNGSVSEAGPTFRVNASGDDGLFYQVDFDIRGDWEITANGTPLCGALCQNPCSYFHAGAGQANYITIRASGSHIEIQVNGHNLDALTDATYKSGYIGVAMAPGTTSSGSVAFSNMRVWRI